MELAQAKKTYLKLPQIRLLKGLMSVYGTEINQESGKLLTIWSNRWVLATNTVS